MSITATKNINFRKYGVLIMGAVLFLSEIFSFFAPLPILSAGLLFGPTWMFYSFLLSTGLVFALAGLSKALFFAACFGIPSLILGSWVLKKKRVDYGVMLSFLSAFAILAGAVMIQAKATNMKPREVLSQEFSRVSSLMLEQADPEAKTQILGDLSEDEWKAQLAAKIPGFFGVALLGILVFNLGFALRIAKQDALQRFKNWRVSEFLVWPSILVGAVFVFDYQGLERFKDVSQNLLQVFSAVYVLQGLSIMSFFFDHWRIGGLFRVFLFVMTIMMMMPLVLAIGFFDQWIDFRSRAIPKGLPQG